jgi:hypothetical protein
MRISESREDARLVLQDYGLYAVFQSSVPRYEARTSVGDAQLYTYAKIAANGWRLARTKGARLIPEHEGPFDVQLRQSMIILPEEAVDAALDGLGENPVLGSELPAEKLFNAIVAPKRAVGAVAIEACGTYAAGEFGPKLTVVDALGGYSVGLQPVDCLVDYQYLASLSEMAGWPAVR